MSTPTGRFLRTDRLLQPRDFKRVLKSGKRRSSAAFAVFSLAPADAESAVDRSRLGITVSRRVGGAVVRNRIKRGVREWYRHARHAWPQGGEIVVIARPPAAELRGVEMAAALDSLVSWPGERSVLRSSEE